MVVCLDGELEVDKGTVDRLKSSSRVEVSSTQFQLYSAAARGQGRDTKGPGPAPVGGCGPASVDTQLQDHLQDQSCVELRKQLSKPGISDYMLSEAPQLRTPAAYTSPGPYTTSSSSTDSIYYTDTVHYTQVQRICITQIQYY